MGGFQRSSPIAMQPAPTSNGAASGLFLLMPRGHPHQSPLRGKSFRFTIYTRLELRDSFEEAEAHRQEWAVSLYEHGIAPR